jgi:AAT family amino acid transporter
MMPAETAAPEQDASVTTWAVLAFMLLVIVLMAITPAYRTAIVVGPIWLAVLLIAYEVKRRRQRATNSIESPTPERP